MKVRWPWYVVGCGVCALLTVVLLGTGDISRALGILIVAASVVASVPIPCRSMDNCCSQYCFRWRERVDCWPLVAT